VSSRPCARPLAEPAPVFDATVLIVAYRSRATLPRLAAALNAQTLKPARVRVLENGSPEAERIDADALPAGAELVVSQDNLGFAAGNNRLAAGCESAWLILLNPDAFPEADWIEQLAAAAERYPDAAMFGSAQLADGRDGVLDGAGDVLHVIGFNYRAGFGRIAAPPPDGETFGPCGAAMMIRRDLFERLGGFDERFFCYVEDMDLAWRARLLGERAIQLQNARVSHMGYGSSGRRSEFATYHGARNRIWMVLKCAPLPQLVAIAPFHAALTGLLWLLAARFGQISVFSRAIGDAFAAWPEIMEDRRRIQAERRVPVWRHVRQMAWNPIRLVTRKPHLAPTDRSG